MVMRMMIGRRTHHHLIACVLIILTTSVVVSDVFDQPKIVVQNGHVVIMSAPDKDISFKTFGGGKVLLNDLPITSSANSQVPIKSGQLESIISRLDVLERSVNRADGSTSSPGEDGGSFIDPSGDSISNEPLPTRVNRINSLLSTNKRKIQRLQKLYTRLSTKVNNLLRALDTNECSSNPCRNGGTCIDRVNGYTCQCTPQYEGPTCEADVNECALFAGTELGCQNGGKCVNFVGGYRCDCPPDKHGVHCTEQHDDCYSASNEALCGHGTCINVPRVITGQPKYTCFCDQGWTTDGKSPACTVDIDECSLPRYPCSLVPKADCINLPGTFHCGHCPPGFTGNGHSCGDIDECATNNGGCSLGPRVQCINTHGSRVCGPCPPGYEGDGVTCIFVGTCRVNNGGCSPVATCVENLAISASYRECLCPAGYIGSGIGDNGCIRSSTTGGGVTAVCTGTYCVHGTCQQLTNQSIKCNCYTGYTGVHCEAPIAAVGVACSSNPCANGGTCQETTTTVTGYICICPNEWWGNECSQPRDACGGTFEGPDGTISHPSSYDSRAYDSGQDCAWTIRTEQNLVLNVTFRSFSLERSSSCSYDFLQIHDGRDAGAYKIGRYCGNDVPASIISSHNSLYLWFHSDSSNESEGFVLDYNSTVPSCGGELEVLDFGTINSPGYPGNYPHSRDCQWLVRVPLGKRIQFHFAFLSIELHPDCTYDFLKIYDGQTITDALLKTFCNSTLPPPITTSGSFALVHFHSDNTMSDKGFHLTYTSVPSVPGCGGLITMDRGSFSSPNFPDPYPSNIQCDWVIRVHPNERIRLSFSSFRIEHQSNCSWDFVAIYDGPDEQAPLITRVCGENVPPTFYSSGNTVFVKFKTDSIRISKGFKADFATVCGESLSGESGLIKSPYYPNSYPSERECIYTISVPIGKVIVLQFLDFNIEDSLACAYDYLEIRDGGFEHGPSPKKLCGNLLPDTLISSFNEIWLKFKTDGSGSNRGFLANYSTVDIACGGVLTSNHGHFSSSRESELLNPAMSCRWLIRAPTGFVIRLNLPTLQLFSTSNCSKNYVLIEDYDSNVLGRFCSNTPQTNILSNGNHMLVTFHIESPGQEFTATYSFENATTACGGQIFSQTGYIRSPNYPSRYPPRKDCVWVIIAPEGKQIHVERRAFDVEGHINCAYDYLEIRNGGEAMSPLLDKYCNGHKPPESFISHSNRLYINFHSDSNMNGYGFVLFFDSGNNGCGGTLTAPSGIIESPNYPSPYGHNAECNWLIKVSAGSTIHLVIADMDIETQENCPFDYLEIFDGGSEFSPPLSKMCSANTARQTFISTSNKMYLTFRSDGSANGRGFRLSYYTNCSTTVSGFRGIIESPNFPNGYPGSLNCTWRIQAPPGNNITLAFSTLHLENSAHCSLDYVQVFEVKDTVLNPLVKHCGYHMTQLPPAFNTTSNVAMVNFATDATIGPVGFRLEWMAIGCGGDFIGKNYGKITSPNYPNGYPPNIGCIWHIRAEEGNIIQLRFLEFDLEGSHECLYDYVKVYSGPTDSDSTLLVTMCHKTSSKVLGSISSMTNVMTIKLATDLSIAGKGFSAEFNVRKGGCSYMVKNIESGIITSPDYPNSVVPKPGGQSMLCRWYISVKQFHTITLTLLDLKVPDSNNCSDNSVAIYDDYYSTSRDSRRIAQLCGTSLPQVTVYKTTGPYASVELKASTVVDGFKIKFNTTCGGVKTVSKSEYGLFTSPNYPHGSMVVKNCSWTFIAKDPGDKITLLFARIFSVTVDADCESQSHILIRDGTDEKGPVLARFCGDSTPKPVMSNGNSLQVTMVGVMVFRAVYYGSTSVCGYTTLTSSEGYFVSPGYPNNYPVNTECIWTVKAPKGNSVSFNIINMNIEQSDYCNSDYLELREKGPDGKFIGRFCGNSIPDLTSNMTESDILWIKFRSDEEGSASGFEGYFTLVHGNYLTGSSGEIESPGWPWGLLTTSQPFKWTITTPESTFVKVTFTEFEIPSLVDGECYSSIRILDGFYENSPEMGSYCGYKMPPSVTSHSNVITIIFDPNDAKYVSFKFKLNWQAIDSPGHSALSSENKNDKESCINYLHLNISESTTIESPGYPFGYGGNINCTWMITTDPGYQVSVKVNEFVLEGHTVVPSHEPIMDVPRPCRYDFLRFYQWTSFPTSSWSLNNTLCGTMTPGTTIELPSNQAKLVFITDSFINKTGFSLELKPQCGGLLEGTNGKITSAMVTRNTCSWHISVRPGRRILFNSKFTPSSSTASPNCASSYLLIRNGASVDSPVLGRYCEESTIPQTASNHAYVQYVVLDSRGKKDPAFSFELEYTEVSQTCGGTYTLDPFSDIVITSPNYPQSPPHDMYCDWTFIGPADRTLRIDFEQSSPSISTSISSSNKCTEDNGEYIVIKDGGTIASPELTSLCIPVTSTDSVRSTGNMMFVRFATAGTSLTTMFRASVKVDICGGTIFINYLADVEGPLKNDQLYSNNMDCVYYLKSSLPQYSLMASTRYPLDIPNSNTETCPLMTGDLLEIRDGSDSGHLLGRFCGNQTIPLVSSESDTLYVRFRSDFSTVGKGFRLRVILNWRPCGGNLETGSAIRDSENGNFFTSPNFPAAFSHARKCTWRIGVPIGKRLVLQVLEYNLKSDANNECLDKLTFISRWVPSRLKVPCDPALSSSMINRQYSLIGDTEISFMTDGLAANEGFKIKYWIDPDLECGGTLTESTGLIDTTNLDNHLNSSITCMWKIETPVADTSKRTVGIAFDIFEVPDVRESTAPFRPCGDNVFMLGRSFYIKERYCGNKTNPTNGAFVVTVPPPLMGNNLFFALVMKTNVNGFRGIKGTYYVQECGGEYHNPDGNFSSPGYSSLSYPSNSLCQWVFTSYSSAIELQFSEFQINGKCSENYIEIKSGTWMHSPKIARFCSTDPPSTQRTIRTMDHMVVVFRTGDKDLEGKFNFKLSSITNGCGGYIIHPMHPVHSSGYPNRYPNDLECIWTIQEDNSHSINISFIQRFDIEMSEGCTKDYILIEEYYDGRWIQLERRCGVHHPGSIRTRSNLARITFRSDSAISGDGFTFLYNAVCQITFTEPNGVITSPNYPMNYPNGVACDYLISQPGKVILLEFEDFSVESPGNGDPGNCRLDHLTIYLSNSTTSAANNLTTKLGPYCGSDETSKPGRVVSYGYLTLQFRSDASVSLKGFKAKYSIAQCGGSFNASSAGLIESSPSLNSLPFINCTWIISAPNDQVVSLRFTRNNLQGCLGSRINIYDGPTTDSQLMATVCSKFENYDTIFKSSGEQMVVEFIGMGNSASENGRKDDFAISYEATLGIKQGCGGLITSETGKNVIKFNRPSGKLTPPLDCYWIFHSNETNRIRFQVTKFNFFDSDRSCLNSYVQIRDGPTAESPLIESICNVSQRTIVSSSDWLYVHLHTDDYSNTSNVQFEYKFLPASQFGLCGGTLEVTEEKKVLQVSDSQLIQGSMPNDHRIRCAWQFMSRGHWSMRILINITRMAISCENNEYLTISNQTPYRESSPLKFCGFKRPNRLIMYSGFRLMYQSSGTPTSGFNLEYSISTCNLTYREDNGVISNPAYPMRDESRGASSNCFSIIEVDPSRTITLYFYDVQMLAGRRRGESICAENKIEIRPDTSLETQKLATICGTGLPNPVFLMTNKVSVYVYTSLGSSSKYEIIYTSSSIGPGCGGNFTSLHGLFTSPFYPKAYTDSTPCTWVVHGYGHHTIELRFTAFNLAGDCSTNYVELYEGIYDPSIPSASQLVSRYCGNELPAKYLSSRTTLSVKMQASYENSGATGFKAYYELKTISYRPGLRILTSGQGNERTESGIDPSQLVSIG